MIEQESLDQTIRAQLSTLETLLVQSKAAIQRDRQQVSALRQEYQQLKNQHQTLHKQLEASNERNG